MSRPSSFQRIIVLSVSFLLWLFVFRDFISGQIPFNGDTNANYLILKYFFNNILNGVFPLWDPYTYLGRHFIYVISSCALNPFAWSIPLLKIWGLDFYQAYLCFIVMYYFLGCLGFRCLLKDILKDEQTAFVGFVMLLFSGMGAMLFNQILIVYIFVPTAWFLVFAVRFFRSFQRHDFLWMVFTLMVLCVSCFPFYFLTFFLVINFCFVVIFPDVWLERFHGFKDFIVRNRAVVTAGLLALLIAAGPMIVFKVMDTQGDAVFPGRHKCETAGQNECSDEGRLSYGEVAYYGSLGERLPVGRVFEHLDKYDYNSDDFFYVPIVAYFLILLALFTKFDRLRLFVLAAGTVTFLIALGAASPLHKFLYERIFYFEFFRNLYFFMAFLIPLVIFFAAAQFKAVLDAQRRMNGKFASLIVVFTLALMWIVLSSQNHVLDASYATVIFAALIAVLFGFGFFTHRSSQLMVLLLLVAVIEPWYVFASYQAHIPVYDCQLPKDKAKNIFLWNRPAANTLDECLPLYRTELYSNFRSMAAMRDSHGLFDYYPDTLMRYAFQLSLSVPGPVISAYSSNKVIVYDQVFDMGEEDTNFFRETLGSRSNLAFVTGVDSQLAKLRFPRAESPKDMIIADENSLNIKALKFDPNRLILATHFDRGKFLVYNDAYSSYWKAYVNGRPSKIYRANMAFKGVYIPAGESSVEFRYEPPGGVWIYGLVLVAMIAVLAAGYSLKSKYQSGSSHEI